jgi:dTDP-4-dehydrorhamnose 3,5-epimerase-like enzyme
VRGDERGNLIAVEGGRDLPFEIARVYYLFGTKGGVDRGLHAHSRIQQYAVCVIGSCLMVLDDGTERDEVLLNRPDLGIHLPPLVWHTMRDFSPDCVLLVLADAPYEEAEYIRNYENFLAAARAGSRS